MHPLYQLTVNKPQVLDQIRNKLMASAPSDPKVLEEYIAEALFLEKKRLSSYSDAVRDRIDTYFWKTISKDLSRAHGNPETLKLILDRITRYHLGEISGHFNDYTYKLATQMVPRGFLWLLQTLSLRSIKDTIVGKAGLQDKVVVSGETDLVRKLSEKGTVILAPTHFSNLDSILVGWALFAIGLPPFSYGAGINLFSNPVLAYFMNNLGAYKVDRKKKHKLYIDILKEYSTTTLEMGCHSIFFPGGGRSRSGALESKIKLGLLGTGLTAYTRNLINGNPKPNMYIIPCVISYNFVLDASSLINEYLAEQGKSRFIPIDNDSIFFKTFFNFVMSFFKNSSKIHFNFGRALDLFGNIIDDDGNSVSPQGHIVDPKGYVTSNGFICHEKQRDQEYIKHLGSVITNRYQIENIVLASHFVAYTFYKFLQTKLQINDIYLLSRTETEDTTVSFEEYAHFAERSYKRIMDLYKRNLLKLEPALKKDSFIDIIHTGLHQLSGYHTKKPIVKKQIENKDYLFSPDINLLYYYHNRMSSYDV